ncbi:unnamed protein product [Caretta caretta]
MKRGQKTDLRGGGNGKTNICETHWKSVALHLDDDPLLLSEDQILQQSESMEICMHRGESYADCTFKWKETAILCSYAAFRGDTYTLACDINQALSAHTM